MTTIARPAYRSDIDGLRAIAVLAVVVFHAFPDFLQGGFIGVDVFFVISGYLISGIVMQALETGTFSFGDFYQRRVKRIFPALLLVLAVCLGVGWFVLLSDEYMALGKHVAGGAVFASNFVLLKETSYFASASDSKPLLHLWSLAVEEQFYLAWPLVLWFAFKRKWNFLAISLLAAGVSFGLNLRQAGIDLTTDFFSPQTRFWELVSGSALACAMRRSSLTGGEAANGFAQILSATGVLLLAYGFCLMDKDHEFPGVFALIPVLGAMLIICAGPKAWVNRSLLSSPILVGIGLISFPLYLWHWPLLSLLRTWAGETPAAQLRLFAVLLSFLLAWLTYRFVEIPVRFGIFGRARVALLVMLVGVAGILGLAVFHWDGVKSKRQDEFVAYFKGMGEWVPGNGVREAYRHQCNLLDIDKDRAGFPLVAKPGIARDCYVRDPGKSKSIFVLGDSHAQQLYFGLSRNLSPDWQILQVATSGCGVQEPPHDGSALATICETTNRQARAAIAQAKPDVVLISQRYPLAAAAAAKVNEMLLGLGARQVLFVGPVTRWQSDLARLVARNFMFHTPRYTFNGLDKGMLNTNAELKKAYSEANINYVDVMSLMCNREGCLTYLGDDVRQGLTTRDYGHLLPVASDFIARNLLVPQIYRVDALTAAAQSADGGTRISRLPLADMADRMPADSISSTSRADRL